MYAGRPEQQRWVGHLSGHLCDFAAASLPVAWVWKSQNVWNEPISVMFMEKSKKSAKQGPPTAGRRSARVTAMSKSSSAWQSQGALGETARVVPLARLSDPSVVQQLNVEIKAMKANPALAKTFLVELGLITAKTGKLTKRFGG